MNERIQKLAREAALAEGWGPGVWQTTFTEKFAELIVRECVNLLEFHGFDDAVSYIKCDFGVEE